jgi:hypothetical protein
MIERIRSGPSWPMNRAGALPVGRYALPNNLPGAGLYQWLQNDICGDGSTGHLIHRDGAARAP